VMVLSCLADDIAAELILVIVRCHCRVMLPMALRRQLDHGAMSLPSHGGEALPMRCWPWRDVAVESC
jgi:hypothetical protein